MEADLMRRVLPADDFATWFDRFLPDLADSHPASLLTPVIASDRSDPQIVHLDGLNLSRAWCMIGVASALPSGRGARRVLIESATRHADAGLRAIHTGEYVGEHWLPTFAVYMLQLASMLPEISGQSDKLPT